MKRSYTSRVKNERPIAPPSLPPQLTLMLRDHLRASTERLRQKAASGRGGVRLAQETAALYDELLRDCFRAAMNLHQRAGAVPPVALLAVGGYGRGTLALGSDLDLMLVTRHDDVRAIEPLAESLFYPLWDAGVQVGHAARTADEFIALARSDLRTTTAVLDARFLAGDPELAADVIARATRAAFEGDLSRFLDALVDEMSARHRRYGSTVYLLEPDLKHARGGLRDIDIARWALRARYRVHDFADALRVGALSEAERAAFEEAREFIWRVRAVLHARAGRRSDRLTFDEQQEAAARLGYVSADADDPVRAISDASEALMSAWYRHARAVSTQLEHVLDRCRPPHRISEYPQRVERVSDEIARFDGSLCLTSTESLRRDPSAALRIVEVALARAIPIAASTRASIADAARDPAWCESLRQCEAAPGAFVRLVGATARIPPRLDRSTPVSETETNTGSVLAELHDLGLMLAMVPEFGHVTGRVQHDVYHVYTVDVHSIAALDRLHAIARGEKSDELALATRLIGGLDRRELVCLATLLHDIGKSRGKPHARVGADLSLTVARRLRLGEDDALTVAWLVLEHLTLYHAATRRDLGDPMTLAQLVETARDAWRLRALYLLTVADLSTTSPTAMTSWKARMLDELYVRVSEAQAAHPARFTNHAGALLIQAVANAPEEARPQVERLLARMPQRYVLATAPERVVRHARAIGDLPPGARRVHVEPVEGDATGELLEIVFAAPDRPGLLALFAALLYANRLDVQSAEIYSTEGAAVDVFIARGAHLDPTDVARIARRLPSQLDDLLDGRSDPDALVASTRGGPGLARAEPAVRADVQIDDAASEAATVIEVSGLDRPGFLYSVARAQHRRGLAIHLAKVNTEGRRVADVFYVTDADGRKLDAATRDAVKQDLLAVVGG